MSLPDFSAFNFAVEPVPDFEGWFRGPVIGGEQGKILAAQLRTSPVAQGWLILVGALDDEGQYIYLTPPLSAREVVQSFGVGAHGGHSAESADKEVGERLEAVDRICPFIVTYADGAGLHAEFTRPLDETAAAKNRGDFHRGRGQLQPRFGELCVRVDG